MFDNLAFNLYMAEAEGYLDTHEGKIKRLLRDLKAVYGKEDYEDIMTDHFLARYNLSVDGLSTPNIMRIKSALGFPD
jgi:hypothetical protein